MFFKLRTSVLQIWNAFVWYMFHNCCLGKILNIFRRITKFLKLDAFVIWVVFIIWKLIIWKLMLVKCKIYNYNILKKADVLGTQSYKVFKIYQNALKARAKVKFDKCQGQKNMVSKIKDNYVNSQNYHKKPKHFFWRYQKLRTKTKNTFPLALSVLIFTTTITIFFKCH